MNDRPLVTFALFAYNQERFIREAVAGAFSQTYSPLEIILSDDCSPDSTFDIMREMASQYAGPHEIVLNRNQVNLGIGAHVNRVNEIARGNLIVAAAGDDVSLPNRCEELVGYWQETGCLFNVVQSDKLIIDADGKEIDVPYEPLYTGTFGFGMLLNLEGIKGATQMYTRKIFTQFGPMLQDTVVEDCVIAMRGYLLGGIGYCKKALVRYRVHGSNITSMQTTSDDMILHDRIGFHRRFHNVYRNYQRDIMCAYSLGLIERSALHRLLDMVDPYAEMCFDKAKFLEGGNREKVRLITKYMVKYPAQALSWITILICPSLYVNMGKNNSLGLVTERVNRALARFRKRWFISRKARMSSL
ncbi:MAG: glycosyltransferase [Syntrophobacteraceae bacterium]